MHQGFHTNAAFQKHSLRTKLYNERGLKNVYHRTWIWMKISTFHLWQCKIRYDLFICTDEYFCQIIFVFRYDSNVLNFGLNLKMKKKLLILPFIHIIEKQTDELLFAYIESVTKVVMYTQM